MTAEPMEHKVIRLSKMSIADIEQELKDNLNSIAGVFDALIRSGRVNGGVNRIYNRVEDEMIRAFRENFVR